MNALLVERELRAAGNCLSSCRVILSTQSERAVGRQRTTFMYSNISSKDKSLLIQYLILLYSCIRNDVLGIGYITQYYSHLCQMMFIQLSQIVCTHVHFTRHIAHTFTTVGIRGNEAVDRVAKEALDKEPTDDLMPFSDLNPLTAKYIHQVWQNGQTVIILQDKKRRDIYE